VWPCELDVTRGWTLDRRRRRLSDDADPAPARLATTAEHFIRVLGQIAPVLPAAGLANEACLLRVAVRALKSALEKPKTQQASDAADGPDEETPAPRPRTAATPFAGGPCR